MDDIRYTVSAEDRFSATFARLRADIAASGQRLGGMLEVAGRVSGALSAVALAGAGIGVIGGIRQLANDLDALNDAADVLGDSVENISALEDVARRNGASLDLVVTAATKLGKVLNEAKPDSPLAQALQAIGLSAEELRGVDTTEGLRRLAVALSGYENDANKARLVQELFGKSIREVAPFLKDLAEATRLNATVTRQQAEEAERFNKELYALQTNASNAARGLVSELLPALNQALVGLRIGREVFGGFSGVLSAALGRGGDFRTAADGVAYYTQELDRLGKKRAELAADARPLVRAFGPGGVDKEIADVRRYLDYYDRLAKALGQDTRPAGTATARQVDNALAARPSLPAVLGSGAAAASAKQQVSEAERYIERLQKEQEKLQELTTVQQLLRDIEQNRIDGITPKLRTQLFIDAARVDALKAQGQAIKAQHEAMDRLVASVSARGEELDRLLGDTPSGQAQVLERQIDLVVRFSQANPDDKALQRQAFEAVDALGKRLKALRPPVLGVEREIANLEKAVDQMAENSIDAIVSLAVDGDAGFSRLFRSFRRDVLRAVIEDPMRAAMRGVVNTIKTELLKADGDIGKLLANVFGSLGGGGGGGGNGGGGADFFTWLTSLFGGSTSRANGGSVRAGQLVRWQEGGREWFVPQTDGAVMTKAQLAAAGGGGMTQQNHFYIQGGGDTAAMRRELQAALEERDAKLLRSLRNGRAGAFVGA